MIMFHDQAIFRIHGQDRKEITCPSQIINSKLAVAKKGETLEEKEEPTLDSFITNKSLKVNKDSASSFHNL
jgi:hypothetical protein